MKGISLAIETIIFIILAVTVMSVLLVFLGKTGGESQTEVSLLKDKEIYCGQYVMQNKMCKGATGDQNAISKLGGTSGICAKLKVPECIIPNNNERCLPACCSMFCV